MATSTNWPRPLARASSSAASRPTVASVPEKMSPMLGPHFITSPSRVPVIDTRPPIAWATMSYDGHAVYGLSPVRGSPNPRTAT